MTIDLGVLESAVHQTCTQSQWRWLCDKRVLLAVSNQADEDLAIAMAMARRKVGSKPINTLNSAELYGVPCELSMDVIGQWRCDEVARVLLLASVVHRNPSQLSDIIKKAFSQGDEYEREAILKGLSLLDRTGVLVAMAVEACRTNILTQFTAIAQFNRYPAQYFDEAAFNQLVLKSLFLGLDVEHVVGLELRINKSLSRMCHDYFREREAAGRSVPTSIWLTFKLQWMPQAQEDYLRYLVHEDEWHRLSILKSLQGQTLSPCMKIAIKQRLNQEKNPNALILLQALAQDHQS